MLPDGENLAELLLPEDEANEMLNRPPPAPKADPQKLARHKNLFASVTLTDLADRQHDETFSARTRLLLYLQIKSRRGAKPVSLTNAMALEIGLDRQQKRVCLRYLETRGYVTVEQSGQASPRVTLYPRPVANRGSEHTV
jgi:hypothetical protein